MAQQQEGAAAAGRTSITRERLVAANRDDSAAERELLDDAVRVLRDFTPTDADDDDDNNDYGATIVGLRTCLPLPPFISLSSFNCFAF